MAFADPQSVTISAVANSLARTGSGVGSGTFSNQDGTYALDVRHSRSGKDIRSTIGIVAKKYATDPARPDNNLPVQASIRIVVIKPVQGFTPADLEAIYVGFVANLAAGTNANVKKLLGLEN